MILHLIEKYEYDGDEQPIERRNEEGVITFDAKRYHLAHQQPWNGTKTEREENDERYNGHDDDPAQVNQLVVSVEYIEGNQRYETQTASNARYYH